VRELTAVMAVALDQVAESTVDPPESGGKTRPSDARTL
jgi:hypothetical protein